MGSARTKANITLVGEVAGGCCVFRRSGLTTNPEAGCEFEGPLYVHTVTLKHLILWEPYFSYIGHSWVR